MPIFCMLYPSLHWSLETSPIPSHATREWIQVPTPYPSVILPTPYSSVIPSHATREWIQVPTPNTNRSFTFLVLAFNTQMVVYNASTGAFELQLLWISVCLGILLTLWQPFRLTLATSTSMLALSKQESIQREVQCWIFVQPASV